jgi:hypothetical protein
MTKTIWGTKLVKVHNIVLIIPAGANVVLSDHRSETESRMFFEHSLMACFLCFQKYLACQSRAILHRTSFLNSFHLNDFYDTLLQSSPQRTHLSSDLLAVLRLVGIFASIFLTEDIVKF